MSWFYRIVKETLTDNGFFAFLENQKTFPGEILTKGSGIDALIVPPPSFAIDFCFFAEIKSLDEYTSNNWLKQSGPNDPLLSIRQYWSNYTPNPPLNYSKQWAVVITGQVEKNFYKKPSLIKKQHSNLPIGHIFHGNNYRFYGDNALSGAIIEQSSHTCYRMKRTIICESACKVDVLNVLRHIGCNNICNMEFSANQLPWLNFNVISYDKPSNTGNHVWYTP